MEKLVVPQWRIKNIVTKYLTAVKVLELGGYLVIHMKEYTMNTNLNYALNELDTLAGYISLMVESEVAPTVEIMEKWYEVLMDSMDSLEDMKE